MIEHLSSDLGKIFQQIKTLLPGLDWAGVEGNQDFLLGGWAASNNINTTYREKNTIKLEGNKI